MEKIIKRETVWMCLLGVILQVITFFVSGSSVLSLVSGISGVFSVVLCSEKKISFYTFGFIQLATYLILCFQENLYGEVGENIFYFLTMLVGIYVWKKNLDKTKNEVKPKHLDRPGYIFLTVGMIVSSIFLGLFLRLTNDTQPWLDSFSTVPAVFAQILMILCYKEQWYLWIIVDVLTGILWFRAGDWCMVSQYVFWTGNCIYGLRQWKKEEA